MAEQDRTHILFIAACPADEQPLKQLREYKNVRNLLKRSKEFSIDFCPIATLEDLKTALSQLDSPTILHFSGHGNFHEIILENPSPPPASYIISSLALSQQIEASAKHIICVFFNTCSSLEQAKLVNEYVPFTLGMTDQLPDSSAVRLCHFFYQSLTDGHSIPIAFEQARTGISTPFFADSNIPKMFENKELVNLHPAQTEILPIYIIANTKAQNNACLPPELLKVIPENRYNEYSQQWKPYQQESCIEELIIEFEEYYGYNIDKHYLQGNESSAIRARLDMEKQKSIAIIDVLSINDDNKEIAKQFNTKDIGGLILPFCECFYENPTIKGFVKTLQKSTFDILEEYHSRKFPEAKHYYPNVVGKDYFFRFLHALAEKMIKICRLIGRVSNRPSSRNFDF